MRPFAYRIWRGFGLYWHGSALTVEVHFWRRLYWGFFDTVRYSATRYTDVGLLGVCVSVVTNDISAPPGFKP